MEDLSSNLDKTKSTFNLWNDARILSHIRTHDFARLKNLNAMPVRNRNAANDNYYNTADRGPFTYAKTNNTVNTVHLQNSYRPPQRLEGYVPHDYSKVTSAENCVHCTPDAGNVTGFSLISLIFLLSAGRIYCEIPLWDGDTMTSSRRSLSPTETAIKKRTKKSNGEYISLKIISEIKKEVK